MCWIKTRCSFSKTSIKKLKASGFPTFLKCDITRLVQFSSVAQSCPTLCDPMNRSTPGFPVHHQLPEFTQELCPLSQWCHPAISSLVIPFSSCPQSLPASKFSPMSQLFAWGGQSTGVSALASFLPKFWGILVRYFVDFPSTEICLMFSSWLEGVYRFWVGRP